MRIEGDIKVWVDGRKACARLQANGPEGPIIIQASAPLGPIRRQVARMFARRGTSVSGDDAAFKGTVKHLARKRALRRLHRLAPRAFQKGALGPYLASRELERRKRMRFALEHNGMPIGPKALGPIPGHAHRRHRRRRRRWLQGPMTAAIARQRALPSATASALSVARPMLAATSNHTAPTASAPSGGGGGERGSGSQAESSRDDDATADTMETETAEQSEADAAPNSDAEATEDANAAAEADADDAADSDEDDAEGEGDSAQDEGDDVEGEETDETGRRSISRRQLRAALRLLRAARRNPRARRRLRQIATLAGEGDPKARKTIKVLARAHKLHRQAQARPVGKPIAGAPVKPPMLPAIPSAPGLQPASKPASAPPAREAPANSESSRWWDILAAWRRGMG